MVKFEFGVSGIVSEIGKDLKDLSFECKCTVCEYDKSYFGPVTKKFEV